MTGKLFIIDKELIILVFFSFSYFCIFCLTNYDFLINISYYLIGPIGLYLTGRQLVTRRDISTNQLMTVILLIGFGYFIHGALNMYNNTLLALYSGLRTERIIDFWSNSEVLRTLEGLYFVIISSLLFPAMLLPKNTYKKYWSFLIIISSVFSLWASFSLGNRTLVVVMIITFAYSGLVFLQVSKKNCYRINFSSLKKYICVCALMVVIYIIFIDKIDNFILESNLFKRFDSSGESAFDTPRWDFYLEFFNTFYL